MFCRHCGKQLRNTDKFCSVCGKSTATQNATPVYSQRPYESETPYQSNNYSEPKKKMNPVLKAFIIILSAGFVIVFLFIFSAMVAGVIEAFNDANTDIDNYIEQSTQDNEPYDNTEDKDTPYGQESQGFLGSLETVIDDSPNNIAASEGTKKIPLLIFALSFPDSEMYMDAAQCYEYIYGDGYYGFGSVDDYYMESSKGMLTFVPADETWGTKNDGIVDMYMDTNHPHFNFERDEDEYYSEGFEFYSRVLKAADEFVDYAAYDADGDGYVVPQELTIMFLFAGYEIYNDYEFDYTDTTYSCSLTYEGYLKVDGVKFDECIYTAEKDPYNTGNNQIAGVGIICHELGHAIDLPDLYDTDYSSEGLAFHCLMAAGSQNAGWNDPYNTLPAPLTAWERIYLGLEEPEQIIQSGIYTVNSRSTDEYNILKVSNERGYYLIENVDFDGFGKGLRSFLRSPGVAIWFVNESVVTSEVRMSANTINDNEKKYGVQLIEAHETHQLMSGNFNYSKLYDHYHYLNGDDFFETDEGIIIEILDNPQDAMRVQITFP